MKSFLVCIHDVTPAFAGETRMMIRDLAPRIGRRLSCGVVPDWHGEWPLAAHPGYCQWVRESADELLLHGYSHRRRRGWGPTTWLSEGGDEMNGLDADATCRIVERGQRVFAEVFGAPARGFLPPAWQPGRLRLTGGTGQRTPAGLEHVVGFFSLRSRAGDTVRLATWTWDCGSWSWLGHAGHAIGRLSQSLHRGVPTVAIHPRDLRRGFWPKILRLVDQLLKRGYEPGTPAGLLQTRAAGLLPARAEGLLQTRAAGSSGARWAPPRETGRAGRWKADNADLDA